MSTKKLSKVYKINDMNNANFTDFGLSCYRVLLNLISKLQRHDLAGSPVSSDILSRKISLSADDYAIEFQIPKTHSYQILKSATKKLMKSSFYIKTMEGLLEINVCSQALYVMDKGLIEIKFTEEIIPHLAALSEQFTMYNLNEIAGFNSIYTTRLYELLMQYKTTGHLEILVTNLRFSLGCNDIFDRYNNFKVKTFSHAVNEINSQFAINLRFEELKKGRTVEKIVFTFEKTLQAKAYDQVRQRMRTQLTKPRRKVAKDMAKITLSS